jgi:periplasmic protein TonB
MRIQTFFKKTICQILVMFIPVVAIIMIALSSCTKEATPQTVADQPEVFVIVEEMPQFPGGDSLMMKFIYENIKYPVSSKAAGIQGRVFIRFCVTNQGGIDRVSVLKGVDPDLNAEAVRVVSMLPKWTPGRQDGKAVNVWFQLPVEFKLQ